MIESCQVVLPARQYQLLRDVYSLKNVNMQAIILHYELASEILSSISMIYGQRPRLRLAMGPISGALYRLQLDRCMGM